MKIKYLMLFLIIVYSKYSPAQDLYFNSLNLNNSTCGYYAPNNIYFANPGPSGGANNQLNVGNSGDYTFVANNKIVIKDNCHIVASNPNSNNNCHLMVANQNLDATILSPANINAVKKFEKVEIGVSLPNLTGKIDEFINDSGHNYYKPGTAFYDNKFADNTIINPYDPNHILISAMFFRPSSPNANGISRDGFYYEPVTNVLNGQDKVNWVNVATNYNWRIRFAPNEVGEWNGYITVWIGGVLQPQNYFFNFTVINNNDNPGYVEINQINKRYFKFSGTGETYFPIGTNCAWQEEQEPCTTSVYNCNDNNDNRMVPNTIDKLYNFVNIMSNTSNPNDRGGNTTRLIMCPGGFQIEFEKLGNYSTRRAEMWELDNYINYLDSNNVYLILSQSNNDLIYESTPNPLPSYSSYWLWNPYNENDPVNDPNHNYKGITGVGYPKDFLTNATAINLYKNRLRYIEARWGYSTYISMNELFTEIEVSKFSCVAASKEVYETDMEQWINMITSYIKNDLKSKHILTLSYVGDHDYLYNNTRNMWDLPNLDVISVHSYEAGEQSSRQEYIDMNYFLNDLTLRNKPYYLNENDGVIYYRLDICTDRLIHNLSWSTCFSGLSGSGLSWEWIRYRLDDPGYGNTNDYSGEYEINYRGLRKFINNINFKDYSYTPINGLSTNKKYEYFYLKRNNHDYATGWVHNRSFNHFNHQGDCYNANSIPSNVHNVYFDNNINDILYDSYVPPTPPSLPSNGESWIKTGNHYDANYWFLCAPQVASTTFRVDTWDKETGFVQTNSSYYSNQDNYLNAFYPQIQYENFQNFPINGTDPGNVCLIDGLNPYTFYNIKWYWTWGANRGELYNTFLQATNSWGLLSVYPPPTGYNGVLYPGDWAFIVEPYIGGSNKSVLLNNNTNDSSLSVLDNLISIFPNPANDKLFIEIKSNLTGIFDFKLYDILGSEVLSIQIRNNQVNQIEVSNFNKGVYSYSIRLKEQIIKNGKIVIQ